MENVVDALYMGAAVLILIIALTISISSYSILKTQMEDIITADDAIDLAETESGEYLNYITSSSDVRTVGVETVVSSIRRLTRESYTIYMVLNNSLKLTTFELQYDLEDEKIQQTYKDSSGNTIELIGNNQSVIKISLSDKIGQNIDSDKDMMKKIYNLIKDKKFKEYQGIYQNNTDVSSVNKETYRIITFVEQ